MSARIRLTPPAARRLIVAVALLVPLLGAFAVERTAPAAEFITPPGLNVEGQEAVLKEQVQRVAEGIVGDDVVEVIANVRYIRTDGQGGKRIKLPGVNHFITPSSPGGEIVSGHARVRQVLVMVKDTAHSSVEAVAEEIRQQGNLDPAKGDLVRVVKVPAQGKDEPSSALAEDTDALSQRLKNQQAKLKKQDDKDELGRMMAQGSLAEAQATTFLIKARQAYFNGNYDRALDQILQSIAQNPNNPQAYAMLGSLYYAVDWKQLALKYWEKSLTLDPDNREIQDLVARLRSSSIN